MKMPANNWLQAIPTDGIRRRRQATADFGVDTCEAVLKDARGSAITNPAMKDQFSSACDALGMWGPAKDETAAGSRFVRMAGRAALCNRE